MGDCTVSIRWHCPRPSEPRIFQEELPPRSLLPLQSPGWAGVGRDVRVALRAFPWLRARRLLCVPCEWRHVARKGVKG